MIRTIFIVLFICLTAPLHSQFESYYLNVTVKLKTNIIYSGYINSMNSYLGQPYLMQAIQFEDPRVEHVRYLISPGFSSLRYEKIVLGKDSIFGIGVYYKNGQKEYQKGFWELSDNASLKLTFLNAKSAEWNKMGENSDSIVQYKTTMNFFPSQWIELLTVTDNEVNKINININEVRELNVVTKTNKKNDKTLKKVMYNDYPRTIKIMSELNSIELNKICKFLGPFD